jgi:RNA polymerase sigma-70 factor (family 1)
LTSELNIVDKQELLARIIRGDEQAFEQLFHQYRNKIYSAAYKLTQSDVLAEEILQDSFLKIWIKRKDLSNVSNIESYLVTTARNHAYDVLRQIARKGTTTDQTQLLQSSDSIGSDSHMIHKEYDQVLQKAIRRLPEQQKNVYLLTNEKGLKRKEVAELLQISPETVKIHLSHAVRFIRAYCKARMDLFSIACILEFMW